MTTLVLAFVVFFGLMWITTDWSGLGCFDGNEPACDEDPQSESSGIGAIRASSWIAGGFAVAALAAAYRVTWGLRRARHLLLVLALNGAVVAIAALLWSRL